MGKVSEVSLPDQFAVTVMSLTVYGNDGFSWNVKGVFTFETE
ncbi:MAG: hypothetical protein ACK4N5_10730 [Myxococcales bacterium]